MFNMSPRRCLQMHVGSTEALGTQSRRLRFHSVRLTAGWLNRAGPDVFPVPHVFRSSRLSYTFHRRGRTYAQPRYSEADTDADSGDIHVLQWVPGLRD